MQFRKIPSVSEGVVLVFYQECEQTYVVVTPVSYSSIRTIDKHVKNETRSQPFSKVFPI